MNAVKSRVSSGDMTGRTDTKRKAVSLADAQLRHAAKLGDPRAQAVLEAEQKRRLAHWTRMFMIDLNHKIELARIHRDGDAQIARMRAAEAKTRRHEEQTSLFFLETRWRWAREDAKRYGTRIPLALATRKHRVNLEQTGTVLPADAAQLPAWCAHAEHLLQAHGTVCTWEPSY